MRKMFFLTTFILILGIGLNAQSLNRLELINASSNTKIKNLARNGETIDLDTHPLINFRGVTTPNPLTSGSCVFKLTYPDGTIYNHSEGTAVYACFGDDNGNYRDWENGRDNPPAIQTGEYKLEIKPGSGAKVTYRFNVTKGASTGGETGGIKDAQPLNVENGKIKITGEKKQWHNVTLNFGGPSASETGNPNPFKDYRLEVTFSKGSARIKVPGYFAADGNAANTHATEGKIWKVHFCPPKTGTWNYRVSFVKGSGIAVNGNAGSAVAPLNGKTGTIEVAASNKTGRDFRAHGRLLYTGDRYLKFEGTGEYFLKAGPDSPENLFAYADFDNVGNFKSYRKSYSNHVSDWQRGNPTWTGTRGEDKGKGLIGVVNYLASKGLNTMSFLTMNINGDDRNVYPYVSSSSYDKFDCSKLDQWEIVMEYAQANGIFLHFKTQETENERLLDDGDTGTNRKLYYRELIARFGHHLALNWNLGEENGAKFNIGKKPLQNDNQRKAMAAYFKNNDPYHNHIVLHTAPNDYDRIYDPLLGNNSELTGVSVQTGYDKVNDITQTWIKKSEESGKKWVVCNDEQGPAAGGLAPDSFVSGNDDKGRPLPNKHQVRYGALWGHFLAGGAGIEYYFGYQHAHSDLTCQDFRSRDKSWEYCKHALDFFHTYLPFWEMKSNNDATNKGYCYSKANKVYVVYVPGGNSVNVRLGSGTYSVKWFDPINGGALRNGENNVQGNGTRTLSLPSNKDWVALIRENSFSLNNNSSRDSAEPNCNETNKLIEAENYANMSGVKKEDCSEGGQNVCWIESNDWMEYCVNVPSNGEYKVEFRVASIKSDAKIQVRVNNAVKATINVPNTGNWQSYQTIKTAKINLSRGNKTLRIFAKKGGYNVNWLKVTPVGAVSQASAFKETNGYVVIEAESAVGYASKGFELKSNNVGGASPTGTGYLRAISSSMGSINASKTISYKVKINKTGTYRFLWRNVRDPQAATGDAGNDSWLMIKGNGCRFYGVKGGNEYTLTHATKTWVQKSNFVYEQYGEAHVNGSKINGMQYYVTFSNPGIYTIEVGVRSAGHCIDRLVMFMNDKKNIAINPSTPESQRVNLRSASTVTSVVNFDAIDETVAVYSSGKTLYIKDANNEKSVFRVYNLSGNKVEEGVFNGTSFSKEMNLPKGLYIIKVGQLAKKIYIK